MRRQRIRLEHGVRGPIDDLGTRGGGAEFGGGDQPLQALRIQLRWCPLGPEQIQLGREATGTPTASVLGGSDDRPGHLGIGVRGRQRPVPGAFDRVGNHSGQSGVDGRTVGGGNRLGDDGRNRGRGKPDHAAVGNQQAGRGGQPDVMVCVDPTGS